MIQWPRRPTKCARCLFRSQALPSPTSIAGDIRCTSPDFSRTSKLQTRSRSDEKTSGTAKSTLRRREAGAQGLFGDVPYRARESAKLRGSFAISLNRDTKAPELTEHERQARIISGLQRVYALMRGRKSTEATDQDQLQELDPESVRWSRFQRRVTGIVTGEFKNLNESQRNLLQKLRNAELESKAAVEIELYFAFLDDVLDKPLDESVKGTVGLSTDLRYPTEWYAKARAQQREIYLHVGPTNSGKTYNALKRLQESGNGFYAGPLRLLAHEVYSRFQANGVPCDLVTGDDVRFDDNADTKVTASTVEMVDTNHEVDVAVIDEIQMMGNEERGWAWTRAFLGANAKEVHLAGESRVVPLVRELAASMGDVLHVRNYERLNPLKAMSRSLRGNLKNLRKGDCVVSFSIARIQALKREIELHTGRRVAIVYGGLPPETRAQQADLFNEPDNEYDYLVASDAIGMGLNLSIKRIVFETLMKPTGGQGKAMLSIPQIKQISGRAGRFRSAHDDKTKTASSPDVKDAPRSVGLVTCLDERDLPTIQRALGSEPPPLRKAGIQPPIEYIEDFAARLPAHIPFEYILQRIYKAAKIHPRFQLCNIRDSLSIARSIEGISGLTIAQRATLTAAPTPRNAHLVTVVLKACARAIAEQRELTIVDMLEMPLEVLDQGVSPDPNYLSLLETLHKSLILYLWLSYRFPATFTDQPMAVHAKTLCEEKITRTLREFSANKKLRSRLTKIKLEQQKLSSEAFANSLPIEHDTGDTASEEQQIPNADAENGGASNDWSEHPAEEEMAVEEEPDESRNVQQTQEHTWDDDQTRSARTDRYLLFNDSTKDTDVSENAEFPKQIQGSHGEGQEAEEAARAVASG